MKTINIILIVVCLVLFVRGWWKEDFVERYERRYPKLSREQKRVRNWVQRKATKELKQRLNTDNIVVTYNEEDPHWWYILRKGFLRDKVLYTIRLTDEEMQKIVEENEY